MKRDTEVFINQAGYLPGQKKYFVMNSFAETFSVINSENQTVLQGEISLINKKDKSTGMALYRGEFSQLTEEGSYKIVVNTGEESFAFPVKKNIYNDVVSKVMKSFYLQRCGCCITEEHGGIFHREECHIGETPYHSSTGLTGTKDVTGGWHDAGDFGRYITPAAVTVAPMLLGYEHFPEKFQTFNAEIPEKGNGVPDILNEVRYELEWMLKMQETREESDKKGAVHYMVNSLKYVCCTPDKSTVDQYIYDFCSRATADFAAVMAQASRIYKPFDNEFSDLCLKRALLAWDFIINHDIYPEKGFLRPKDTETGGYAGHRDLNLFNKRDIIWPGVELFITTGDTAFQDAVTEGLMDKKAMTGGLIWFDKVGFPEVQYIMAKRSSVNKEVQKQVKEGFLNRYRNILKSSEQCGFHVSILEKEYTWGSNGEILTRGLMSLFAYMLTHEKEFEDLALNQLNYILGLNIHNLSFVVDLGTEFPRNIHHATLASDGIDASFPGLLAGGPNRSVQADEALGKAFKRGTPGALCYIDHGDSYSSNENCITYSASLPALAAWFSLKE